MQKPRGWYTGEVDLWDLPKERIYIDLKEPFRSSFIKSLKENIGNKAEISRAIGEPFRTIRNFIEEKQSKSLLFFENLIELLEKNNVHEFNHNTFRKNVKVIKMANGKPVINPKIPFNFNTEDGAIIVSAVFHDGGLANPSNPTVGSCFHYRNYNNNLIEYIVQTAKNVFGDMNIIYQKNHTSVFFPKIVGMILIHGLGLEPGHKNEVNPNIPEFVINYDNKIKAKFLQQAFDDDGCVEKWNELRGSGKQISFIASIDVSNYSQEMRNRIRATNDDKFASNIIKIDKRLLNDLGIFVHGPKVKREYITKKGKTRHSWKLLISDKRNIETFYNKIGFKLKYKQNKLKKMLETYKK